MLDLILARPAWAQVLLDRAEQDAAFRAQIDPGRRTVLAQHPQSKLANRAAAIFDLLEENHFEPADGTLGPFIVHLGVRENRLVAVGNEARGMLGRAPERISIIRPMREGVIADYKIGGEQLFFPNAAR